MVQVGLKDLTEAKFLIGKVLLVSLCCIFMSYSCGRKISVLLKYLSYLHMNGVKYIKYIFYIFNRMNEFFFPFLLLALLCSI